MRMGRVKTWEHQAENKGMVVLTMKLNMQEFRIRGEAYSVLFIINPLKLNFREASKSGSTEKLTNERPVYTSIEQW